MKLPRPLTPNASYVPTTRLGDLLIVSGQLAFDADGGMPVTGRLGAELDIEAGQEAARRCALHFLAQVDAALGGLDEVGQILKLTVFVAATPEFDRHHIVANGASDLLAAVLGERGRHSRSAFGVSGLPFGSPVELEGMVSHRPSSAKGTS
jgi:enamine deaminase RidA (YjgF/YER057c/UK114 family)